MNNSTTTDTPLIVNNQTPQKLEEREDSMFGLWKPNSPEYNRLKELTGRLKLAIEPDLIDLADDLLQEKLITKDTNWLMYSRYCGSSSKAAELVKAVLKKVQSSPEDYHKFVKVLKRNSKKYKGHYRDIIRALEKPLPPPPQHDEDQDLSAVVREAWKNLWACCSLPLMVYFFILAIVVIYIL